MKSEKDKKEQEEKLKALRDKTKNPDLAASIDKKIKQGGKPFNK